MQLVCTVYSCQPLQFLIFLLEVQGSHLLLHMNVKDDCISREMVFASAYIERQFGETLCAWSTVKLEVTPVLADTVSILCCLTGIMVCLMSLL